MSSRLRDEALARRQNLEEKVEAITIDLAAKETYNVGCIF
jgi:hypothetical protein